MPRSFRSSPLGVALLLAIHSTPALAQRWECSAGPLTDSLNPSREGFFREVLFAPGSARTARFDDYTPGSYHVDKVDLATGIAPVAQKCGVVLEALVVVGPVGPLWAYHVIALLTEDDSLRVSRLVMPHARITIKTTNRISRERLDEFLRHLADSSLVHAGQPTWPDTTTDALERDFSYNFLVVRYRAQGAEYWHASSIETDAAAPLREVLTALLKGSTPTYLHGN